MNQEEENDIIFETDIDQSDEECVGHDIEQREVYYQPADDYVKFRIMLS